MITRVGFRMMWQHVKICPVIFNCTSIFSMTTRPLVCKLAPARTISAKPQMKGEFEKVREETSTLCTVYTHYLNILLQENIATVPNLLSFSRIVLSPMLGYLVVSNNYPAALGLFAVAGLSDMVT